MSIVKDNNSWRITGDGAERAVLAFAHIVDGQLIYERADGDCRLPSVLREVPMAAGR
jgi:hypothetical protein